MRQLCEGQYIKHAQYGFGTIDAPPKPAKTESA